MNVWIWGPPMWDILHSTAFLFDSEKKDMTYIFECLEELLPCIHCRNSYKEFYAEMGHHKIGSASKWVYDMHNKVNLKLWRQKFNNDDFIRPVPEVVAKRYLIKEEKLSWSSISTTLLAIVMYIESCQNKKQLVHILKTFLRGLGDAANISKQPNKEQIINVLKDLAKIPDPSEMRLYLEKVKYGSNSAEIREITDLIRAGSCLKKTCV